MWSRVVLSGQPCTVFTAVNCVGYLSGFGLGRYVGCMAA